MSATVIYVVEGSSGEYSDHREWQIAAYASEAEARKHAEAASAYARETHQMYLDADGDWDRELGVMESRSKANPYDRYFADRASYDHDVRYTAYPVPIRKHAPTPSDPMRDEEPRR